MTDNKSIKALLLKYAVIYLAIFIGSFLMAWLISIIFGIPFLTTTK